MFFAMLRGADEHLDQIVVQAVEELALEGPFELRVVEIAGMQFEIVDVNRRLSKFRADDHFHRIALGAGVEFDKRMLVESELVLHERKAVASHPAIVSLAMADVVAKAC